MRLTRFTLNSDISQQWNGSPVLDLFLDCLLDAALDTLRLVPFLLVTYFDRVALEYKAGAKAREGVARA